MAGKIEILAPAGSPESLKAAVCAGADAVYVGGARFGARAYAKNLSEDELLEAVDYVHIHGRRIYLTVNTLLKDQEMDQLYEYLLPYYLRGLDGVIVQDIGVIEYLRTYFPDLPLHASTQMTITGTDGAAFLKEQGIVRVVAARELSLEEIRRMKRKTGLEVECFVHGALCYCYSGQCLMSSMIGGRSGNRGQCAQPCRLPYSVGGGKAADVMSLKDLCTIDMIPQLVEAGIDSFKIEGRMKQPDYVYTVVSLYRKYTDLYFQKGAGEYRVESADRDRLLGAYRRRGYTDGYYRRQNGKDMISFTRPSPKDAVTGECSSQNGIMSGGYPSRTAQGICACPDYKLQEKINGNLILFSGERAKLVLEYLTAKVECEGEVVQPALRQPLEKARAAKQMRKTGNTEFIFDRLGIEMKGEVFLPMQALNELRREGLARLEACILEDYRRKAPQKHSVNEGSGQSGMESGYMERKDGRDRGGEVRLSCTVQTQEQLEEAVGCGYMSVIYIDSELGLKKDALQLIGRNRSGRRYYLALPYICRESQAKQWEDLYAGITAAGAECGGYDGALVRNWESFGRLAACGWDRDICLDQNLYVFNRYGKTFIKRQGITRYTAPAELNARELRSLDIAGAVMSVYGYQPVMVTANCIRRSTDGCRKEEGYMKICDRLKKQFAVRTCCRYCYNVIYNSAPLFLADKAGEIMELSPGELRLDFTVETKKETRRVMEMYIDAFIHGKSAAPPVTEYTRGHFRRGVK